MVKQNYFEKVHQNKVTSKIEVQVTLVFDISKRPQKEMSKRQRVFIFHA